ncbi:MAG: hypothetical protein ACP59X_04520 [Solidesulfovibrio sp. DCME]|uniref:hypothetical protein n=1 Tax=Solidesulfovibrio sp. DCME TaxID=3447380 RepID=UPI003D0D6BDB
MRKDTTVSQAERAVPYPVSLVYTMYRHGAGLSEREALERAQAAARRLRPTA